jgi:hypothetical protein
MVTIKFFTAKNYRITLLFRNIKADTHNEYEIMVFDLVKQNLPYQSNKSKQMFLFLLVSIKQNNGSGYEITDAIEQI